jgi:mono/diheme cytochrome c family protein
MKYLFPLMLLVACSSSDSLKEKMYLQYSHGFYILTEKEVGQISQAEAKLDPVKAKRGAKIYQDICMRCHGVKGNGKGPRAMWEQPPANLVKRVKGKAFRFYFNEDKWQERMPNWKMKLSKEDVEDLRHFIMSLAES